MFVEPSSDLRIAAKQLYAVFAAFLEAGFKADQALQMVIAVTVEGMRRG